MGVNLKIVGSADNYIKQDYSVGNRGSSCSKFVRVCCAVFGNVRDSGDVNYHSAEHIQNILITHGIWEYTKLYQINLKPFSSKFAIFRFFFLFVVQ